MPEFVKSHAGVNTARLIPAHLNQKLGVAVTIATFFLVALTLWQMHTIAGALLAFAVILLIQCARVDVESLRIPNAFTYAGLGIVIAASAILPEGDFIAAIAGAGIGGGLILVISLTSGGRVGLGDAKLAAFGGALVGLELVLPALFLGTLAAALTCAVLLLVGAVSSKQPLPYGPFLSLGFILTAIFVGSALSA